MQRWLTLMPLLMVTAALSGCFGGDDNGTDPTPTPTPPATNNTTPPPPPNVPPIPNIAITAEGDASEGNASGNATAFFVPPSGNFTVNLDGAGSTDSDGTITNYAWIVTGPDNFRETGTNQTFAVEFISFKAYGAYDVVLRALDDRNGLSQANTTFYVNLDLTLEGAEIPGPGTGANDDPHDAEFSCINEPLCIGTYQIHSVGLKSNATKIALDLAYETSQGTVTLRVFPPGAEHSGDGAILEEEVPTDGGSFEITEASSFSAAGSYVVRLDVAGAGVQSYTLGVQVFYDPQ